MSFPSDVLEDESMITFTRTYTAQPGKFFDLIAQSKENAAIVKKVVGLEVSTNVCLGASRVNW